MPDLLLEQNYYDALLSGFRYGSAASGQSLTDLPPDVDKALVKAARKMTLQAEDMVFNKPGDREEMVSLVNEWLNGEVLDMNELRASLRPLFGEARALRIARTESARTMNLGNAAALRSHGWGKVMWLASAGACDACEEMNGTVMSIDEYEDEAILHPNAYMGETKISGKILSALKAFYSGPIFTLKTARGHRITLTANHPVLTSHGWIAANQIRKGDNVFTDFRNSMNLSALSGAINNQDGPIEAKEIFNSLRAHALSASIKIIDMTALDFHGDSVFLKGDVEVVGAYAKLLNKARINCVKRVVNGLFQFSNMEQVFIPRFCPSHLGFQRIPLSPSRRMGMSGLRNSHSGIIFDPLPENPLAFGNAANWNVSKPKSVIDDGARHAKFLRELQDRSSGLIAGDEIVNVDVMDYIGHVYDLQSKTGWVQGDNYIISNCACTAEPIDDDVPDSEDLDAAAEAVDVDPEELGIGEFTAGVDDLP